MARVKVRGKSCQRQIQILDGFVDLGSVLVTYRYAIDACIAECKLHLGCGGLRD